MHVDVVHARQRLALQPRCEVVIDVADLGVEQVVDLRLPGGTSREYSPELSVIASYGALPPNSSTAMPRSAPPVSSVTRPLICAPPAVCAKDGPGTSGLINLCRTRWHDS